MGQLSCNDSHNSIPTCTNLSHVDCIHQNVFSVTTGELNTTVNSRISESFGTMCHVTISVAFHILRSVYIKMYPQLECAH